MAKEKPFPRILLAATSSGAGKTTMTAALLGGLKKRGLSVQTMKAGPDYIDPMFHSKITGRAAVHADPFFSDGAQMQKILTHWSQDADLTVIEGAMGFYDGIGTTADASTYTVSRQLETPVLLVLSSKGMGCSAAAMVQGFMQFRKPNAIKGILLSRVSEGMYGYYKTLLERETGLPVYGYLPEQSAVQISSRHLGLQTAAEVEQLEEKLALLAEMGRKTLDLDGILQLAQTAPPLPDFAFPQKPASTFRLGVSQDAAFSFVYAENLQILTGLGAEIVPVSPLSDACLPEHLDGLYLCGGYPELYAKQLSGNHSFLCSLRNAAQAGMPIFAECGGFLYLQESFTAEDGTIYPMAQLLPGRWHMTKGLRRFGYVTLTAQKDSILGKAGTVIRGHEFHYGDTTENGDTFLVQRPNGKTWMGYQSVGRITAGFPHLYFPSALEVPKSFAAYCQAYRKERICP